MQTLQDDILAEYLAECGEMLEKLGTNLANLEKEKFDRSVLRGFARDIHTVKGSSQLFGFRQIGRLSHAVEECLERVQQTPKESLHGLTDVLFEALDQISKIFAVVKQSRSEPQESEEFRDIIEKLANFSTASNEVPRSQEQSVHQSPDLHSDAALDSMERDILEDALKVDFRQVAVVPGARQAADDFHGDSIRVHVDLLDTLMTLVSELVLIRNEVNQITKDQGGDAMLSIYQRLNAVTAELQNSVMKTRMQPIGNLLGKFQRVVRDLSKELGKSAILELDGAETELDKALLETIRDPLIHLIRNAMDHGIEKPDERAKAAKPVQGSIQLRAVHENGYVTIEIEDDGRGIDHDRIRIKAFERALLTPDLLGKLTDQETLQLIFLPGFSTADQVSNVSGRGVGMDVVKTNIERIGGTVSVRSKAGKGARVTLKIPLTLAIISALLVECSDGIYAIPQVKLLEILKVPLSNVEYEKPLDLVADSPVIRLRGKLLPLIDLRKVLKLQNQALDAKDCINVVVVHADSQLYGIIVDEVVDSSDIVVKPLSSIVKSLGVYTGASILADGRTALILDVNGIADKNGFLDITEHRGFALHQDRNLEIQDLKRRHQEKIEYLLFEIGVQSPVAIPLCLVHRLEEFPLHRVQYSGDKRVVKYGDSILPLITLREVLGIAAKSVQESHKSDVVVIVVRRNNQFIGLEVEMISDILLSSEEIESDAEDRFGVLGSLVHDKKVILILDVLRIAAHFFPSMTGPGQVPGVGSSSSFRHEKSQVARWGSRESHHVLLVEDGNFLRKQISAVLKDAGFRVSVEADGEKAWDALENSQADPFSIVISDIEMPVMDGFELIKRVRKDSAYKSLPVIALTSRFNSVDIEKGMKLGFNRYLEKMNPMQLVTEIDQVLGLKGGF